MKINHKLIRQILQIIGISAFLVSIFFKLKAIILMGGTKSISGGIPETEDSDNDDYDDDDDDSVVDTPIPEAEVTIAKCASF